MSERLSRRAVRENVFKLVFEYQFREEEEKEARLEIFRNENGILHEDDWGEVSSKFDGVVAKIPEIDELLNKVSKSWKTTRMNKADLSILRVAAYEILFDENVPDSVAINEAVELAKKYSGEEASPFVNGILAAVVKEKGQEKSE